MRAVITGEKWDDGKAKIVSLTDYYPYGMDMPGRNYTAEAYRYGYQGSERDRNMQGGTGYTTFFRSLDPRLGRWLNPDPKKFPWQSPYCSMDCNPIGITDVMGDEGEETGDGIDGTHIDSNGAVIKPDGVYQNGDITKGSFLLPEAPACIGSAKNINSFNPSQIFFDFQQQLANANKEPWSVDWNQTNTSQQQSQSQDERQVKMPSWASTTDNTMDGVGFLTGFLEGNFGLTANQTIRYGQRVNGRVVSAAELSVAHTAQSLKYAKALGRFNMVTGVIGTGYSITKASIDYNNGGWEKVDKLDLLDAGVGTAGILVSTLVTVGMASNPVGWGVAIGSAVYFGARLVYDLTLEEK